jgi:hypothetical protein
LFLAMHSMGHATICTPRSQVHNSIMFFCRWGQPSKVTHICWLPNTGGIVTRKLVPLDSNTAALSIESALCVFALLLQWLGTFDFEALEFTSEGEVFYFPRDHHCDVSDWTERVAGGAQRSENGVPS